MEPCLSIQNLSKVYHSPTGETLALQDIHLEVQKGEFISLVGPSGSGKSTLLTAIAGLDTHYSGTITTPEELPTGYMFQRDELLEWRTVLDNACLGLEIQNQNTPENIRYVQQLLKAYGLNGFQKHYPSELSGGMRQRVALIRTMALKPALLLLDEPFSALDYQTRLQLADEIWKILKETGMTAILVTHDIAEAVSMSDRIIILSSRPGTILQEIPIEYTGPRNPLAVRQEPRFQSYFQQVWEVMQYA